jgi:hypothetical protein
VNAKLCTAMADAFTEIEAATKASNNPHFKSKYADLGAVIDAVKPALIKNKLFFTQHPQPNPDGVSVETFIHHASGESLSLGTLFVPANKRDAQGFGSALTYARRYALMTAFGVPAEDDDGHDAAKSVANDRNDRPSGLITDDQRHQLIALIQAAGASTDAFLEYLKVRRLDQLPAAKFEAAREALNRRIQANAQQKAPTPREAAMADIIADEVPY